MAFHRHEPATLKQGCQITIEGKELTLDSLDPGAGVQGVKDLIQKKGVGRGCGALGTNVDITNIGNRMIQYIV